MERELIMTGIGGQGIQLAAAVVAHAAMAEGREVQVFGSYGGMMRGGNTEATVVVADGAITAPPTTGATWSAIVMHGAHAPKVLPALRPEGVCMVNSTVVEPGYVPDGPESPLAVELPATAIALELGNVVAASMVMTGAYAAVTGLAELASLTAAVVDALPPYRAGHADLNERALAAGFEVAPRLVRPAWSVPAPAAS